MAAAPCAGWIPAVGTLGRARAYALTPCGTELHPVPGRDNSRHSRLLQESRMSMFPATTYLARRAALLARLRGAGARGVVLLPGHVDSPMNCRDTAYDFASCISAAC